MKKEFLIALHSICTCHKNTKCNCKIGTICTFHIIKAKTPKEALTKFWSSGRAYDKRCYEDLILRVKVYSLKSLIAKKRPAASFERKGIEVNWEKSIEPGSAIHIQ